MAPPYKRFSWTTVIIAIMLIVRLRKREKRASIATKLSEVQLGSVSTSVSDIFSNPFRGFFGLPERPGQPECAYYMKTGDCRFGNYCKFHHPRDRETHVSDVTDSSLSHPSRPGNPVCASYFHTGKCSSRATCIFDHPSLIPTHRNISSLQLYQRGFTSSIGDSSSELVEAATKKRRIHKNTSRMASERRYSSPLRCASLIGDSSIELVEASTLAPPIDNAASMAFETPHSNPLECSSSLGAYSSEPVEASTLPEITQTPFGIDNWDFNEEDVQDWVNPYGNFNP